jgi:hypothetical protein
MKSIVDRALHKSGDSDRYLRRMTSYPTLAKFGCFPQDFTEIANDDAPWFCHGLAFRMATFSDNSDYFFERWETLLKLTEKAIGWKGEYNNWNQIKNHWAKRWDKFHQFIWLLQCYEHFSQCGCDVSFPWKKNEASPDLLLKRKGHADLFVECFFYTKWWPLEEFLEMLLYKIDKGLDIKRIYNIQRNASANPLSTVKGLVKALDRVAKELTPKKFAEWQAAAQLASPQKICEIGDFSIILEGDGEYQPSSDDAQGDPARSWQKFVGEIIEAKRDKNNLRVCRPNILMVNGLGRDFQNSHSWSGSLEFPIPEHQENIDEIWLSVCGIDELLGTCLQDQKVRKKLCNDYAGSGF